jgi:hypothetical protein
VRSNSGLTTDRLLAIKALFKDGQKPSEKKQNSLVYGAKAVYHAP